MIKAGEVLDDRVIIPDWILNMTSEERQAEIKRLEAEAKKERDLLAAKKNSKME